MEIRTHVPYQEDHHTYSLASIIIVSKENSDQIDEPHTRLIYLVTVLFGYLDASRLQHRMWNIG
jgi:hypothetical protein